MTEFKPATLDKKWQQQWAASHAFEVTTDPNRPKFYCLEMFAYPSGHAHVGHVRNYMIGDVVARMKRTRGFNVLHPFGWDAFGLPAENAAIKAGTHPETWTLDNIAHMKGQLQRLGISYAWEREVATCLPDYYRWNQWVFLKMLERDLAVPCVADAEALELPFHMRDVVERRLFRVRAGLDRRVLGRQAERVPPERVQYIEAAHALHAGHDVTDQIVADVADMRVPRRVGKHLEAVELGLTVVLDDLEGARVAPPLLPLLFDSVGLVVRHDLLIIPGG